MQLQSHPTPQSQNLSTLNSMNQTLSNLARPPLGALEAVGMALIIEHGLINLFLTIDHKWPILHHLLIQRQSRNEHEASFFRRVFVDFGIDDVAFALEDYVVILAHCRLVFADAEGCGSGKGVCKCVPADG